ncbi:hypothetical protein CPB97_005921, partial [Podila verticillata]
PRRSRSHWRIGGQGVSGRRVEGQFDRVEWWSAIPDCPVADPVSAPVQASANVHSRRGGCCAGSFSHTKHWPAASHTIQGLAVHCCVSEGGYVQQRQRSLPCSIQRWNLYCRPERSEPEGCSKTEHGFGSECKTYGQRERITISRYFCWLRCGSVRIWRWTIDRPVFRLTQEGGQAHQS